MTNKCVCGKEADKGGFCSTECLVKTLKSAKDFNSIRIEQSPPVELTEEVISEQIKHTYELTEIEVQRINLQPGDTLMVTLKNDYIEQESMVGLRNEFNKRFPNNKVFIFAMGSDGDVKLAVVSQPEKSYCSDCDCGKKAEGSKND